jgi:hypothetical protein
MQVLINHNVSTHSSLEKLMIINRQEAEEHTLAQIEQVNSSCVQFDCATIVFHLGLAVVWVHVQIGIERTRRLSLLICYCSIV